MITIKKSSDKAEITLLAITNFSVNLSYGGNTLGKNIDDEETSQISKLTKNVSFSAYIDGTGMLYPAVETSSPKQIITKIQDILFIGNAPSSISFDENLTGDSQFNATTMNINYELMDKNGTVLRAKIDFQFKEFIPAEDEPIVKSDGNKEKTSKAETAASTGNFIEKVS
ncbi:CIS tube protein [Flammeovirga kamogawensis]|uniref:Contractile injection system tube protein N-terminal domain-containing protein n=1 Tax=Flammeovirga kamogawensis TaxID=373891 RepID=A0ABX8GXU3_9BACT|nr:hypothetical protein [Flammeovirga kamogawensis]MBB6458859.1 hypothetical protein [Flammeovirga kamogawensis]QWG08440.1 hypothetical protein KM029_05755 [Flammeovirga kamogawensis]TRX66737.1 hypothetical protein EO216_00815 [Flammeovirga kamogawensis]